MMRICFFARVKSQANFDLVGFYRDDIRALGMAGHDVVVVNSLRLLLRTRCDAYFVWWFGYGVVPAIIGKFRGRPVVVTGAIHTGNCGGLDEWPLAKRLLMKLTMKVCDVSLLISKTDFLRLGDFRPRRHKIVYCAVDGDLYSPGAIHDKGDYILSITHLTHESVQRKRLFECLEAFGDFSKTRPTYEYIIAGEKGPAYESLMARANELGIAHRVIFPGRITNEKKVELLRNARVYLQPSECEGFGLAILEAESCGTPVVTSREPCVVEINGDSVVYGSDWLSLSKAMRILVDDDRTYIAYRDRGFANAGKYSYSARALCIANIFSSLEYL